MAAFQDTREQTGQRVMIHLLTEIERNPTLTQRDLASELGIALGLMNKYIKSCLTKGWIRASKVSPSRVKYFLTPEGFAEKSQMVGSYLSRSLTFFRESRLQCEVIFQSCVEKNYRCVALVGSGDVADIASLVAHGMGIDAKIVDVSQDLSSYSAALITDDKQPQKTYDLAKNKVQHDRLFVLDILHVSCLKSSSEHSE
jgi:DNA-binding MarR family transcriptional regulator